MADRTTIERVAKILAKANSDNEAEAEAALRGAYGRMKRDGVAFKELLSLPVELLYQDTLARLIDYIVKVQVELSPPQKRALYAEYLKKVVEKFSTGSGGRAGEGGSTGQTERDREREAAAGAYEERRRQEEARRARSDPPPRPEHSRPEPPPQAPGREENTYSRQNVKTSKDGIAFPMYFDPNRFPFPSSGADFFYFFFGAGSFIGCIYSFPKRALELMFTSMLVGGLTAAAMFVGLHLLFDWSQIAIFSSLWRYLFQGTTRGFVLAILVTAFVFYERGWYPRGPRHGATDLVSITASFWRLSIAAGWRLYGVVVWIVNTAYVFGVKWKRAQVEKGR